MVKLKDIANECGVSVTQVSRALNDHPQVNCNTKSMVLEVAKRLGYVKNIYASNLALKSSKQIGIIIVGFENDLSNTIDNNVLCLLQGISEFSSKNGFEPVIYINNRYNKIDYISFCKQRQISGLIIFGCDYNNKEYVDLIKSDFPCVSIDIVNESDTKGCVIVNNTYYAQEAVNHLINIGCKHIALMIGNKHSHATIERMAGYKLALYQNNIELDESIMAYGEFELEIAKFKTIELLTQSPYIDAFFCMSDQMAVGCYEGLKKLNKKIPEDIKVFGFDGIPLCNFVSPVLSTVKQDFKKKGYAAAELITSMLNGEAILKTIVIPCTIVLGESCK